jgi:hypothetical protein
MCISFRCSHCHKYGDLKYGCTKSFQIRELAMGVTKEVEDLEYKVNEVTLENNNGNIMNCQRETPKINAEISLEESMKGSSSYCTMSSNHDQSIVLLFNNATEHLDHVYNLDLLMIQETNM